MIRILANYLVILCALFGVVAFLSNCGAAEKAAEAVEDSNAPTDDDPDTDGDGIRDSEDDDDDGDGIPDEDEQDDDGDEGGFGVGDVTRLDSKIDNTKYKLLTANKALYLVTAGGNFYITKGVVAGIDDGKYYVPMQVISDDLVNGDTDYVDQGTYKHTDSSSSHWFQTNNVQYYMKDLDIFTVKSTGVQNYGSGTKITDYPLTSPGKGITVFADSTSIYIGYHKTYCSVDLAAKTMGTCVDQLQNAPMFKPTKPSTMAMFGGELYGYDPDAKMLYKFDKSYKLLDSSSTAAVTEPAMFLAAGASHLYLVGMDDNEQVVFTELEMD